MRTIVFLSLIALLSACSRGPAPRQFALTGQVLEVRPDGSELVVRHDDVKGFMPAMTMPFKIRDRSLTRNSRPGDLIRATLVVTDDESWLSSVEKVGWAPIAEDGVPARPTVALLKPGDTVPDETLIDQDGRPFRFSAMRGSAVLVTFIYTRCPLPDFCPRMDAYFSAVQKAILDGRVPGPVHLLSVSFDPENDTPAVLKAHAARVGANPRVWTFATAPRDRVEGWGASLGLSVIRDAGNAAAITHNLRTAVVDRQGRLATVLSGNQWTPEEAIGALTAAQR